MSFADIELRAGMVLSEAKRARNYNEQKFSLGIFAFGKRHLLA